MKLTFLSLCMAVMPALAQTELQAGDFNYHYKAYTQRVSCHDPSIVIDSITNPKSVQYYIYGSHLGRGKTTTADHYQKWTLFGAGEEATGATGSLFADADGQLVNYADAYATHLVKKVKNYKGEEVSFGNFNAHDWQFKDSKVNGNQWAPDVIWNKTMKKWCMYMSLNGDKWGSSIVCFVSDNIEGPWQYQGPVVFSGFQGTYDHNGFTKTDDWKQTDLAIATGDTELPARYKVGGSWGTYWPNCIDPCVFYDDDDNLWMSYGSWSGGIFMLRLNKENGLRDYTYTFGYEVKGQQATPGSANANCTSDPYFGKKIAGGYYVSGEASYIEKIGKYYFLFMSYGELQSTGGYQMRVFRSDSPTGPFVDPCGTSAIYQDKYVLNYHSQNGNAKDYRGLLLMGGYQWQTMPSPEIAQGHNSAFTDKEGRSFVVYHTRFNDGGEGHEVRVHQLFLNDEGWLVSAPYEFDGETITNEQIAKQASIDNDEIPGTYQLIIHQYDQNTPGRAYEKPVNITLAADGTVTGNKKGSWTRTAGTDFITLTLAGVDYRGVLVRQTIDYTDIPAICIAAVSSSSGSTTLGQNNFTRQQEIWASKAETKSAIAYTYDRQEISYSDGATLSTHTTPQAKSYLGTTVTWKSSDASILSDAGAVKGKGTVAMTLTVAKEDESFKKVYTLKVDRDATDAMPVFYPESQLKTTDLGFWQNFSKRYYQLAAGGKLQLKFRNHSNMAENYKNWILVACNNYERANNGYKEYLVLRNDAYGWGTDYDAAGLSHDFDWSTFKQDMNDALVEMTVEYTTDKSLNMKAVITTTSGKTYNYSYTCSISAKPNNVKLFLTGEGSYFDSENVPTAIKAVRLGDKTDNQVYNIRGQRTDKSHQGVVVTHGKKVLVK
ncbi:MAG: glycoside hydrolase family 43 protein [Prevotella sp.]|nr:glycoside hydrolase family 43 protein [Prevotella sp.]MDY5546937.1 glycoside hydrolase family 43 protein [Prevotella sp.]